MNRSFFSCLPCKQRLKRDSDGRNSAVEFRPEERRPHGGHSVVGLVKKQAMRVACFLICGKSLLSFM